MVSTTIKKKTYQSFEWLVTRNYLPEELSKLHICPPLAAKFQNDKDEQARGFQEVYIGSDGQVSTRIYWLNQATWSLGLEFATNNDATLKQFEMGRTFESVGRLEQAEAAYAKATESDWPPARENALRKLSQVIEKQIRGRINTSPTR